MISGLIIGFLIGTFVSYKWTIPTKFWDFIITLFSKKTV